MTAAIDPNEHAETAPEQADDLLLAAFVRAVNTGKGSLDVALWVHGEVVTGTLTSAPEYIEGLAQTLEGGNKPGSADAFREIGQSWREDIERFEESEEGYAITSIHLKNARTFIPGAAGIPTHGGVWWRGRLFGGRMVLGALRRRAARPISARSDCGQFSLTTYVLQGPPKSEGSLCISASVRD